MADEKMISMPLGVVVRKTPGVTRWASWSWRAIAVLPGADTADWREMRRESEAVEYHAGTLPLELFRTDTEAYLNGLTDPVPSIYVILRDGSGDTPLLHKVTASPYEAQDYLDSGEEEVEKVPMPEGLVAWIKEFVEAHHKDEVFIKRRRDRQRVDLKEDGKGDARVRQTADVYRAPGPVRTKRLQ